MPEAVPIDCTRFPVRLYISRPWRCFKCQRFGHVALGCRAVTSVCVFCAEHAHQDSPCTKQPKSANCDGDYPASSRNCFYYKFEAIFLNCRREKSSAILKLNKLLKEMVQYGFFAFAVKSSPSAAISSARNSGHVRIMNSSPEIPLTQVGSSPEDAIVSQP